METKALLYGLIGFFLGGLIVSLAATYLPATDHNKETAIMRTVTE